MPKEFTTTRRVQFAETDAAGVLYFGNYYRIMEEVEHAFWRSVGVSLAHQGKEGATTWPRVATSCEYFAPVRFEDEIELAFRLTHVGQRSLSFEVEFRHGRSLIALGRTTAVCCSLAEGAFQPIAIPEEVRAKIAPYVSTNGE